MKKKSRPEPDMKQIGFGLFSSAKVTNASATISSFGSRKEDPVPFQPTKTPAEPRIYDNLNLYGPNERLGYIFKFNFECLWVEVHSKNYILYIQSVQLTSTPGLKHKIGAIYTVPDNTITKAIPCQDNYVNEDVRLVMRRLCELYIEAMPDLLKRGESHPAWETMLAESRRLNMPSCYQSDLFFWDKWTLATFPGHSFIWVIRESGTHLIIIHAKEKSDYAYFSVYDTVRALVGVYPESKWYYCSCVERSIRNIQESEVYELVRVEIERLQSLKTRTQDTEQESEEQCL
jgi:hypothetical protein